MTVRLLTNTQRAQLHDILVKRGVDPGVTTWTNDTKSWCRQPAETLEVGLCHFLFHPDSGGLMSLHVKPGPEGGVQQGFVNETWDTTLHLFSGWAGAVKRELEQEDP